MSRPSRRIRSIRVPPEPAIPELQALLQPLPGVPPRIAVVQPVTKAALAGIMDAVERGLARALLVGNPEGIQSGLRAFGREPGRFEIEPAKDDNEAAAKAVAIVRAGGADLLMKGHLHTDDFLRPVLDPQHGLRGPRRMSHAFLCFFRARTYHKPLLITDAAMNIAPGVAEKADIARNAIEFLHALGVAVPKIAALAAVESVNRAMPATVDAYELAQQSQRGELGDTILEGPLAFDNAISAEAAAAKGIRSQVAGDPDVLLVPDLEAGNILYKSLVYLCGVIAGGIVLGAKVPVLLTSRTEPPLARTLACALAARMVQSEARKAA